MIRLNFARNQRRNTMCYDISFTVKLKELPAYFPDLETAFNWNWIMTESISWVIVFVIIPSSMGTEGNKISVRPMEWGSFLLCKDEKSFLRQRASMLNTRSERILGDEKSYWYKIRNRAVSYQTTGIYEHRAIKGWKKKCLILSA